jgi:glutamate synthase (NADPH/NADH) large chain
MKSQSGPCKISKTGIPQKTGLYSPEFEKDSCGIGLVANLNALPSHQIVLDALTMLERMSHRGAKGCEENTGDGAGLLCGMPHLFFRLELEKMGYELPKGGSYAVAMVFLPPMAEDRCRCKSILEHYILKHGQRVICWREVPVDAERADIGNTARSLQPAIEQCFISAENVDDIEDFERKLYLIRKQAYHEIKNSDMEQKSYYYMCSCSSRLVCYKGQLTSIQLRLFHKDLRDPVFSAPFAMVHSRFSTNTFPSWDRAQPMRYLCHNGEINTLRGNVNWAKSRQSLMESALFGKDFEKLFPLIDPITSDSGMFDNLLELLMLAGRSLPEAMMIMIPEAWQNNPHMDPALRAFYEFHSCLLEPWDGPAAICFTDGRYAGAVLDRNGLRPGRYWITNDGRVILASEAGVLDVDSSKIISKGRLRPGQMFLIDFDKGRLVPDAEIKREVARKHPYESWIQDGVIRLSDLVRDSNAEPVHSQDIVSQLLLHGYSSETLDFMLLPLVKEGRDPIGSMGNDTPLTALSKQNKLVFDYFKQLFAQVTNPAIDPIREEIVMSLECPVGPEHNLLDTKPDQCHRLVVGHPLLSTAEASYIRNLENFGWKTEVVAMSRPEHVGLQASIHHLCLTVQKAVANGADFIVLSDQNLTPGTLPVPSLLACGAVHHALLRAGSRQRVGLVIETGEAREVHHFCCLIGYGADAIHPYLAYQTFAWAASQKRLLGAPHELEAKYRKAVGKGILKVLAKSGISTLQSYKGAQVFEAVGLHPEVVDLCFIGTTSRIQGVGFRAIDRIYRNLYDAAFEIHRNLPSVGEFHWRSDGEEHMWNPRTIADLQQAALNGDTEAYRRFSSYIDVLGNKGTIRGNLRIKKVTPVPLEEVEAATEIVRRFCTGAMSFGSISAEAHEAMAIAMNRLGGKSNTGEGGEDQRRWTPDANGDSRRSAIKQIASGRFGVTIQYLTNADELQIKIAQGAKPGEGGELPGSKVDDEIARTRFSTPGVGLISPPPHHDIYSIEDLAQLIFDLRNANPTAKISVKLVSVAGVGVIAAGVAKAHADLILISGHDGGTGASPLTSIKHAGLPWELGLAEAHQTLTLNGLRSRVKLQTDGQIKTGRDVVVAALLGADEIGFSTAPLITLGCLMMRKCHLNTCPVGIATQDPELRAKFAGKPESVINYLFMVAEEVRETMAALGFRTFAEMVGRADMLDPGDPSEINGLDLSPVLTAVESVVAEAMFERHKDCDDVLDRELITECAAAIRTGEKIHHRRSITTVDRAVGGMLSHEIAKCRPLLLPDDTINLTFTGTAGQSFGVWLARGVTFDLEGEANDYVGKGLSGGRIVLRPPKGSHFAPEENIIAGNAVLYGATAGELFARGQVGERFAVRNSGAVAVVEGVGDHGCEYMTGGRVVVLGPVGRNFAAGMSGGIAYIHAENRELFHRSCNLGSVAIEEVEDADLATLEELLQKHYGYTGSRLAERLLKTPSMLRNFMRVMPNDYKKVLVSAGPKVVVVS